MEYVNVLNFWKKSVNFHTLVIKTMKDVSFGIR